MLSFSLWLFWCVFVFLRFCVFWRLFWPWPKTWPREAFSSMTFVCTHVHVPVHVHEPVNVDAHVHIHAGAGDHVHRHRCNRWDSREKCAGFEHRYHNKKAVNLIRLFWERIDKSIMCYEILYVANSLFRPTIMLHLCWTASRYFSLLRDCIGIAKTCSSRAMIM